MVMGCGAPYPYNAGMAKRDGKMNSKGSGGRTIALNRRAKFDFHLEERFEAGLALEGWEVKSLRAGKAQLTDSYVIVKDGEAYLLGAHIPPLPSASSHIHADPTRTRKLLLHRREIARILGATSQKGYTAVATALYWRGPHAKCEIALAKGKKQHDKRETRKEQDWNRERQRILKEHKSKEIA